MIWQPADTLLLVTEHLHRRPAMEPIDLYKLIYQAVRGPEHLIASPETFIERLQAEWAGLELEPVDPLWEAIRPDGWLMRLNLRPYKSSGYLLNELVSACLETGQSRWGSQADLETIWGQFVLLSSQGAWPGVAHTQVLLFTERLHLSSFPSVHHSDSYRKLYQPAFRLVAATTKLYLDHHCV